MALDGPMLTSRHRVALVDAASEGRMPDVRTRATRDRTLIQEWARRRGAEPATGETTASGHATVDVRDGDAGIRFNFPGFQRFRAISWDEWFDNFERHGLTFIFELEEHGKPLANRWRLVPTSELSGTATLV